MARGSYIGVAETTFDINRDNIASFFTTTNASPYYFAWSDDGTELVSNNQGVKSTTAQTTLTALVDITVSLDYSYSSEKYDKFYFTANGETIVGGSGGDGQGSYLGKLKAGQTLLFKYTKDSSLNNGDDESLVRNIKVRILSTNPNDPKIAHKVLKVYKRVNGVAHEVKKVYAKDSNSIARLAFSTMVKWNKYACTRSTVTTTTYTRDDANAGTSGYVYKNVASTDSVQAYTGWSWGSSITGFRGSGQTTVSVPNLNNQTYYMVNSTTVGTWWSVRNSDGTYNYSHEIIASATSESKTSYSYTKGDLIGTVEASEGEYPEDLTHVSGSVTDSYIILRSGSTYYYYTKA